MGTESNTATVTTLDDLRKHQTEAPRLPKVHRTEDLCAGCGKVARHLDRVLDLCPDCDPR